MFLLQVPGPAQPPAPGTVGSLTRNIINANAAINLSPTPSASIYIAGAVNDAFVVNRTIPFISASIGGWELLSSHRRRWSTQ